MQPQIISQNNTKPSENIFNFNYYTEGGSELFLRESVGKGFRYALGFKFNGQVAIASTRYSLTEIAKEYRKYKKLFDENDSSAFRANSLVAVKLLEPLEKHQVKVLFPRQQPN